MAVERYSDMTLTAGLQMAKADDPALQLLSDLAHRVNAVRPEMARFGTWCDRADLLYYAETFTDGGADIWPDDPNAHIIGRAHVSINTPPAYVDVPAALQAVAPIENMLATDTTKEAREAAAALERIYTAWKAEEEFELKFHKACTTKALYGRTFGRVYWDPNEDRPCVEVVDQPRNVWVGYQTDSSTKVEWAAFYQRMSPNAVAEEFNVDIGVIEDENGVARPYVIAPETGYAQAARPWLPRFGSSVIEVWDYWYRKPARRKGRVTMTTWNVVVAGNAVVRQPTEYPEYGGTIPYVPLFNTYIPGVPDGRAELYDMEHIIREKQEKITNGSQMIGQAVGGDYWQLVGPEAPARVPDTLKPVKNKIIAPGAGNRVETIAPFVAQFQLEQFLARLDREGTVVSGLNDLLLGLAPAQVLSSSKAINALIANYESRLSMRRKLLYSWRRNVWKLALNVWARKNADVRQVVEAGGGTLDILDPSLSPRDEMETATRAGNLVAAKLWSQRRGMDAVHVDDPETEQDLIREESTDGTLWPDRVMVMAQLLSTLQQLGLQANPAVSEQAQGQLASGQADLRQALLAQTPQHTTGSQLAGDQGVTPPIEGAPPEAGGAPDPFAMAPQPGQSAQLQSMVTNEGGVKGRILTQRQLGRR